MSGQQAATAASAAAQPPVGLRRIMDRVSSQSSVQAASSAAPPPPPPQGFSPTNAAAANRSGYLQLDASATPKRSSSPPRASPPASSATPDARMASPGLSAIGYATPLLKSASGVAASPAAPSSGGGSRPFKLSRTIRSVKSSDSQPQLKPQPQPEPQPQAQPEPRASKRKARGFNLTRVVTAVKARDDDDDKGRRRGDSELEARRRFAEGADEEEVRRPREEDEEDSEKDEDEADGEGGAERHVKRERKGEEEEEEEKVGEEHDDKKENAGADARRPRSPGPRPRIDDAPGADEAEPTIRKPRARLDRGETSVAADSACVECLGDAGHTLRNCLGACVQSIPRVSATAERIMMREVAQGVRLPPYARELDGEAMARVMQTLPEDAVMSVNVLEAGLLEPDPLLLHPLVRMHVVNLVNGEYLHKSRPDKAVVYPTGEDGGGHAHILPLMTRPCDLRAAGSFRPTWRDEFLLNDSFEHLVTTHTLLLFEVLDFGARVDLARYPDGLYPVAWAFLKLVSMHGQPNLGAFRLQLHRFSSRRPAVKRPHVPPVYFEWVYQKNSAWLDYPSTLSVYVRGAPPPAERQVVAARPMFATDREVGRIDFAELSKVLQVQDSAVSDEIASRDAAALSEDARRALLRTRAPNARCHVPDTLLHEVSTAPNGVFAVAFSPNGRLLAAACADRLLFTVKVFETDSGTLLCTFNGHHDLVYDLGWNRDGSEIVSASSDHTAQVWSLVTLSSESVLSFQHTSFVYAAQFHPVSRFPPLIVTASYDAKVRVWSRVSGALLRVLSDHAAHVNSLVFDNLGHRFFTGDAVGVFKIFDDRGEPAELVAAGRAVEEASSRGVRGSDDDEDDEDAAEEEDEDESPLRERERSKELQRRLKRIAVRGEKEQNWDARFQCVKSIAHPEIKGDVINCVRFHRRSKQLLVYCRDNALYLFTVTAASATFVRKFSGSECRNSELRCEFSPDGRYVLAGSEDGRAYFWQASNGQLVRVLETGFTQPLFSVAWHPTQHLVALGSFGADFPLLLFERQAGAGGPQSPPDSPRARDP